jgi:hypothetical protein
MNNKNESQVYLTPDELVARWRRKVSRRTLSNWRSSHEGPRFTKIGGRVLYALNHVEEWERERTIAA